MTDDLTLAAALEILRRAIEAGEHTTHPLPRTPPPDAEPTLREVVAMLDLPDWMSKPPNDRSLRRLLDGESPRRVNGVTIEGYRGLGDQVAAGITTAQLTRFRDQVARHVGTAKVAHARAYDRPLPSYRPGDHGHGAARNFVQATKRVFAQAQEQGLLRADPARRLKEPPDRSLRRALEPRELSRLRRWISVERSDPELDELILDLLERTGARLDGLVGVRLGDIDVVGCLLHDCEKYGKQYTRPVARSVLLRLRALAERRGATHPTDRALRRRRGEPVTKKYVQDLFHTAYLHGVLPAHTPATAHWLRHTLVRAIGEAADEHVARSWAGHSPKSQGVTAVYQGPASLRQLRQVAETLFGPLEDVSLDPVHLEEGA